MTTFKINGTAIKLDLTNEQTQAAAAQIRKEYAAKPHGYDYLCLDKDDVARFKRYTDELTNPAEMSFERRCDLAILLQSILEQAQRINKEHLR